MSFKAFASCSFGLEALVSEELRRLGAPEIQGRDARVYFAADPGMIARANLWLRTADRVYLELASFPARTFQELFEGVASFDWPSLLPVNAKFPVAADSIRSALKSVPDIQSISKKAVVERLKKRHKLSTFPENGPEYPIYVSIYQDNAVVALNTSGAGLNRRGYRTLNAEAPLRETLAAGIVALSRPRPGETFIDPMCGSGTIAIEAALRALGIAPGLNRSFAFEPWNVEYKKAAAQAREEARSARREEPLDIRASDIDEGVLKLARIHARQAGVEKNIVFTRADVAKLCLNNEKGVLVTNPPYAVRLGETEENRRLYGRMGEAFLKSGLHCGILCADDEFERYFKRRADKKRKLYNGNIRCTLYQYFK